MEQYNKMEHSPMLKLLLQMSFPAMLSMLIQALYNIIDSLFVAQIGEDALTAVSLAFPIQSLIIAVGVGTGIGLNSLIARSLGEQNHEKASKVADHGIILAVLSWLAFLAFGLFGAKAFFAQSTDSLAVQEMGTTYLSIVTMFSIGCFVQINIEKIFQGTGNMIYPMIMQIVGAVTNIILDPIFIFGWFGVPKMGVAGAAIATVIGQMVAMGLSVYLITKRSKGVRINFKGFKWDMRIVREIYSVGIPSIVMQSITSVLVIALNGILIGFSQTAVAVLGIYFKVQSFVFMPVFGLTQGALPIMGYSYGAQNKERLMKCLKQAILVASIIMGLGTLMFWAVPEYIIYIFNGEAEMMRIGVMAFRAISMGFLGAGVSIVISTYFQAIGKGVQSLVISIVRQLVVLLPVAYFLSQSMGEVGVWLAFPIAEVVAFIGSIALFLRTIKADKV